MKKLCFFLTECLFLCSCGTYYPVCFDLKTQAIIPCNGSIRRVEIDGGNMNWIITGQVTNTPIYVNKPNPDYQVTDYLDGDLHHMIKLKPNTEYTLRSYNGMDQGAPLPITFKTNEKGIVVSASDTICK